MTNADVTDPTLAVAERQLVMLGELAQIAMAATRAFGSSAVASAVAEKRILADEYFVPEVGRARACGAKDAAESLQKVSRAMRLTLKLEMAVAEIVRDVRAGIVTHTAGAVFRETAGWTTADQCGLQVRRRPAGRPSDADDGDRDRREQDTERFVEFDSPDRLPRGSFRNVADGPCSNIGAKPNLTSWSVGPPKLEHQRLEPRPPGRETQPLGPFPSHDLGGDADRFTHPPPR